MRLRRVVALSRRRISDKDGRVKVRRGKVVLVNAEPTRMLEANILAYRIIAARAERDLGLDLFLRMQRDAHHAMQPTKAEEAEGSGSLEPIRPVFRRAEPTTTVTESTKEEPAPPTSPLTVDGQEYE